MAIDDGIRIRTLKIDKRQMNVKEGRWEIAHDFIAKLFDHILASWRVSAWQSTRPWIIGV
jgi:hypothetical protein